MPIFASGKVGLSLFLPREEGGDQAQEGQPRLDQRKQHRLLLSSESHHPIIGLNNPEHIAEGLRNVEIHSCAENHQFNYLVGVDQGAEVDDATDVQLAALILVYEDIRLTEVVVQNLLRGLF